MNKKICFILCVIIITLSITSISASENITDDKISEISDEVEVVSTLDENINSLKYESQCIEYENCTTGNSGGLNGDNVLSSVNEEILNAEEYDFYVSPDGTGDGKSSDNPTNWSYMMDHQFEGMKIKMLDGTFYINSQSIQYPHTTIVGSTDTVIDGQNKAVLFTINQAYNVFENITFKNGKSASQGRGNKMGC